MRLALVHEFRTRSKVLVCTEAGVRVAGLDGAPAGEELVIAAPPALFGPLHDALRDLDAAGGP